MSKKEALEQLESLTEAWNLKEADLNQTDINAIEFILQENQKLKERIKTLKDTQLKQLNIIKQRDEVIDEAIQFIKDTCIEQIPDMLKGCYREIASIGDLEELLEILKRYKGGNSEIK